MTSELEGDISNNSMWLFITLFSIFYQRIESGTLASAFSAFKYHTFSSELIET